LAARPAGSCDSEADHSESAAGAHPGPGGPGRELPEDSEAPRLECCAVQVCCVGAGPALGPAANHSDVLGVRLRAPGEEGRRSRVTFLRVPGPIHVLPSRFLPSHGAFLASDSESLARSQASRVTFLQRQVSSSTGSRSSRARVKLFSRVAFTGMHTSDVTSRSPRRFSCIQSGLDSESVAFRVIVVSCFPKSRSLRSLRVIGVVLASRTAEGGWNRRRPGGPASAAAPGPNHPDRPDSDRSSP
jgi:hypothetical protein